MSFDLDESQHAAREAYLTSKNVGLFGRAGCGKSAVLRRCIAHAQRVHGSGRVGILAWSNEAANLINGVTLHKFLGVGIAELPKDRVLAAVRARHVVKEKIMNIKVIIFDELPMVSARWFDVAEDVVRQLALPHKQARPWGGCQVIGAYPGVTVHVLLFFDE